jgi:hypothetical protein
MTNSEGLALQKQMLKHLTGKTPKKKKVIIEVLPWVVENCKPAICRSSMSSCSKKTDMHAIT